VLRLKIPRLNKADSMLPPGSVLHVVIRAQKRHQTGTACRRQTDVRWQSLLNRQISASLLSSHQMQWSTRRGAAACSMANDRIRSSGRGRIRGEMPTGISAFSRGSRNCTTVFIWCPLLFRVPIFPRASLHPAHHRVRCGKIVENKLVCPRRP